MFGVKAVLGQTGIAQGVDYRGVPALGVLRAVPDSPWFLVAREVIADVYAPLQGTRVANGGSIGRAAGGSGAGLGFVWRQQRLRYFQGQAGVVDALRETRDYLDSLIEHANAPIITWDTALRITRFNRAFERLTGYAAAEVVGQELSLLFQGQAEPNP